MRWVLPPLDPDALRAAISDLDHRAATSAQLRVEGPAGRWAGEEGAVDGPDDRFRIGSVAKVLLSRNRFGGQSPFPVCCGQWWVNRESPENRC